MTDRVKGKVDLVINGARIVTGGVTTPPGWIAVDGGKIVSVGCDGPCPEAKQVIQAQNKHILPGLVDAEHHPHHPIKDAIITETQAAVATGITTAGIICTSNRIVFPEKEINSVADMPSFMDACDNFIGLMTGRSMVDYFITPGLNNENHFREIPDLVAKYGITSFKIYLHLMTGEKVWNMWGPQMKKRGDFYYDDGSIYRAMVAIAEMGPPGVLCIHPENWEIARVIRDRLTAQGRNEIAAFSEFSPAFCEAGHIRTYAYYANVTKCPIWIIHTTTPDSIREIQRAREEGTIITANTGPHYLCLTPEYGPLNVPLRPKEYHPVAWEALKTGIIDTVSSDSIWHMTRSLEDVETYGLRSSKKNGWIESYFNGSNGFMLPVMLSEGVNKGRISLERLVEVCCENPAKIFGLYPKKGTITVGSDADFVIVDLEEVKRVTRDIVISRGLWSVWEGWELKGWPVMTILRGNIVMEWPKGEKKCRVIGDGLGKYLPRELQRKFGNRPR